MNNLVESETNILLFNLNKLYLIYETFLNNYNFALVGPKIKKI